MKKMVRQAHHPERSRRIILTACLIALAAGCKKPAPAPGWSSPLANDSSAPAAKAETGELSGAAAPASTAAATTGGMLAAPGNYIRTTVGQVEKARAAKALFETTAKEQTKNLDLNDNEGN